MFGNIMTQSPTIVGASQTLLDSTMAPDGEVEQWYGVLHGAEQHGSFFGYKRPGVPLISSSLESHQRDIPASKTISLYTYI